MCNFRKISINYSFHLLQSLSLSLVRARNLVDLITVSFRRPTDMVAAANATSRGQEAQTKEIKDKEGNLLYTVGEFLGGGGYGSVYAATDIKGEEVAIKFEPKEKCRYGTPYEWEVYRSLGCIKGHQPLVDGVVRVHYLGSWGEYYVMVMDKLKGFKSDKPEGKSFSTKTVGGIAKIAAQALKRLEDLHERGYFHGDVKFSNFLQNAEGKLILTDFGLACRWKDSSTNQPFEYKQRPSSCFRGTTLYASVHVLLGRTFSRRDDLISLLYTLIDLVDGSLPWKEDKDRIISCKEKMEADLCSFDLNPFREFAEFLEKLTFDGRPKYADYIQLFASVDDNSPCPRNRVPDAKKVCQAGWITVFNSRSAMKQRYHFDIEDKFLNCVIKKGHEEKLNIRSVAFHGKKRWSLIMDGSITFAEEEYKYIQGLLWQDGVSDRWIGEELKDGYFVSCLAGGEDDQWLVVLSKGATYSSQVYQTCDSYKDLHAYIENYWKLGYFVTALATTGRQWTVVMSRNAGLSAQVIEFDVCFPDEGIQQRWNQGYKITTKAASLAQTANNDQPTLPAQIAVVMSIPRNKAAGDELQEIFLSEDDRFPSQDLKEQWLKKRYVTSFCHGPIHLEGQNTPFKGPKKYLNVDI